MPIAKMAVTEEWVITGPDLDKQLLERMKTMGEILKSRAGKGTPEFHIRLSGKIEWEK